MTVYNHSFNKATRLYSTRDTVGGKAASLVMLEEMNLRTPDAWIVQNLAFGDIERAILRLKATQPFMPKLFSVRSSGRTSMPGMMTTLLNVGLTEEIYIELKSQFGDLFASEIRRQFLMSWADKTLYNSQAVKNCKSALETLSLGERPTTELNLGIAGLLEKELGTHNPLSLSQDSQLDISIRLVQHSFNSDAAIQYRKLHNILDERMPSVIVQSMVYGNLNENSGTGVAFSRHPDTGYPCIFGEYLPEAQGEQVVDGTSMTYDLSGMSSEIPTAYEDLSIGVSRLEREFKQPVDVEFTIQDGKLWFLQVRPAKCSDVARVRTTLDMYKEGTLNVTEAVGLISKANPVTSSPKGGSVLCSGIGVTPSSVIGKIVYYKSEIPSDGSPYVFVAKSTTPNDLEIMQGAVGIITLRGGPLSHAAIVARELGKVCVVGAEKSGTKMLSGRLVTKDGYHIPAGTEVELDGTAGSVTLRVD